MSCQVWIVRSPLSYRPTPQTFHHLVTMAVKLTPTSTPKEIYSQINSVKQLRLQANLFEAALAEQQKRDDAAAGKEEKKDARVTHHSTAYNLYQAVTSFKKRHKRQYPTLDAAFEAHRSRKLAAVYEDDDDRIGGSHHDAEPVSPTPSFPSRAATSLTPSVSTGDHVQHGTHKNDEAFNPSLALAPTSVISMHNLLCQLSQRISRIHSQVRLMEGEFNSLQAQLTSYKQLLSTCAPNIAETAWDEAKTSDSVSCFTATRSSTPVIGDRSPVASSVSARAELAMECEEAEAMKTYKDLPVTTITASPQTVPERHGDLVEQTGAKIGCEYGEAHIGEPRLQAAAATDCGANSPLAVTASLPSPVGDDNNDLIDVADAQTDLDEPLGREDVTVSPALTSRHPQQSDGDVDDRDQRQAHKHDLGHGRGLREDEGEMSTCRLYHRRSSVDHVDVTATSTESNRRCVWVQSTFQMCENDLAEIFSHFGQVERVDVPRPRADRPPFAFVHFRDEEDARSTVRRAMHGALGCLTVKAYQPREDAWQPYRRRL